MSNTDTFSVRVQMTRALHVRRMADRWLLWLAGSPYTENHTTLHLHDNGDVERVVHSHGRIDVLKLTEDDVT